MKSIIHKPSKNSNPEKKYTNATSCSPRFLQKWCGICSIHQQVLRSQWFQYVIQFESHYAAFLHTQKKSESWWCKLRKNTRDRWDLERQRVGASILQTESMETCPVVYSTEQHRWDWSGQGELSTQRQEETRHGNPGLSWTRGKFSELLHVYTNIWCCLYCTTED